MDERVAGKADRVDETETTAGSVSVDGELRSVVNPSALDFATHAHGDAVH